jgi:hypothetical protein
MKASKLDYPRRLERGALRQCNAVLPKCRIGGNDLLDCFANRQVSKWPTD